MHRRAASASAGGGGGGDPGGSGGGGGGGDPGGSGGADPHAPGATSGAKPWKRGEARGGEARGGEARGGEARGAGRSGVRLPGVCLPGAGLVGVFCAAAFSFPKSTSSGRGLTAFGCRPSVSEYFADLRYGSPQTSGMVAPRDASGPRGEPPKGTLRRPDVGGGGPPMHISVADPTCKTSLVAALPHLMLDFSSQN